VWSSDGEERINPLPFLHKKKYKKVYETIFASKKAVWVNTTCTK
jgi:hypothetical protein